MKNLLIILILFISTISYSQSSWNYYEMLNQEKTISSINFINADIGYALAYETNNSLLLYM